MPLKPFDITNKENEVPEELREILVDAGLAPKKEENKKDETRAHFDRYGAGVENIAAAVGSIMANGETDAGRLKAAELALKVQGILDEKTDKIPTNVVINIIGKENKTLLNLVMPRG